MRESLVGADFSLSGLVLQAVAGGSRRSSVVRCQERLSNPKRAGELSEAAFVLKASEMGFLVAKPWGDSEKYDFILDAGWRLWRVQLKSTAVLHGRGYEVQPIYSVYGKGKAGYTAEDIDALVVHVRPLDVWYVLPVEAFLPGKNLRFYPDIECKAARWEKYRESWDLLRKSSGVSRRVSGSGPRTSDFGPRRKP